ncbi:MAG: YqaA family protein [Planctomycetota bacterium]
MTEERTETLVEGERTDSPRRKGILRRLYDWVLHWAHTPYGTPALAILSFTESSFFPLPPDPLLLALSVARPRRSIFYAFVCTTASVLGGLFGYWIGMVAMDSIGMPLLEAYGQLENFERTQQTFQSYGFLAILGAALTPIPYKVFTIAAGSCDLAISTFVVASILGRGLRFFAEGLLILLFGASIQRLIDRYFDVASLIFLALLVLGFVIVKWLF